MTWAVEARRRCIDVLLTSPERRANPRIAAEALPCDCPCSLCLREDLGG